jgi:outer membrane protein OmpU
MRKLLLGTTALAAAATLSANAALADVSISGYYEWTYQSRSSTVATSDGTSFGNESEVHIKFNNKTDSGLDIGMTVEMMTDASETGGDNVDESSISIAGGFGKFVLGENDSAADNYAIDAEDVVSEEIQATGTDTLALLDTDVESTGDGNKLSYHLPAMGGLKAGISYTDNGTDATSGAQDSIEIGATYTLDAGGASITIGGATVNTEQVSGTVDTESKNLGVSITSGNITAKVAQATYEATNADEEANGVGVSFKVSDSMTIGAYTVKVEDGTGTTDEEYSNTGAEVAYTIASGLTAYVNISDYDYKTGAGTGQGTTADNGTVSKLTLVAKF